MSEALPSISQSSLSLSKSLLFTAQHVDEAECESLTACDGASVSNGFHPAALHVACRGDVIHKLCVQVEHHAENLVALCRGEVAHGRSRGLVFAGGENLGFDAEFTESLAYCDEFGHDTDGSGDGAGVGHDDVGRSRRVVAAAGCDGRVGGDNRLAAREVGDG